VGSSTRCFDRGSKRREHLGVRDELEIPQPGPHELEELPEDLPLRLRKARLAPEPRDVSIALPRRELPGVDHLLPLGPQETRRERVPFHGARGIVERLSDDSRGSHCWGTAELTVEPLTERWYRVHVDALRKRRLVSDQAAE